MSKLILVTGGAGFIGSHLCERLAADGHRVISLDNYFTGSKKNHVPGVEYREGHTKDIEKHIPETPDIMYHLGEYSRVEQSVLEPDIVADLNTVGTTGIIEFWKKKKSKLVYAGSSTKFGDGGAARHASPYASTKAANTERVKEVGEVLRLPYAITYFYNVYGPRERSGMYGTVMEIFKQLYLHGVPFTVTKPGTQSRNFTHVRDIVEGLVLIGEKGEGDEFGLGNERAFSILDVARLFGAETLMLPERKGNRMHTALDTAKSHALGWRCKEQLEDYIRQFLEEHASVAPRELRVLVFSTTFYPVSGPAEDALLELIRKMPKVQFDIVTTHFTPEAHRYVSPQANTTIHRVGYGTSFDKYLLPVLGPWKARALVRSHKYLFTWSIFAGYAALAAILVKRRYGLPLLITLADQELWRVGRLKRVFLRLALSGADQVYGMDPAHEQHAAKIAGRTALRKSIGEGDAFANQLRFVYSQILADKQDA